jgi:hypothetical protein
MTLARPHRCGGLGAAALVVGAALGAAPLAGCFADATEVVVVVDTDMLRSEFGSLGFTVVSTSTNSGAPMAAFNAMTTALPATMGVVPVGPSPDFDVTVTMWPPGVVQGGPFGGGPFPGGGVVPGSPMPLMSRKASHVRFVTGEQRTLFLPIARACLCEGTSCPHALEPACRELISPVLTGFASSGLPRFMAATPAAP